MSLTGHALTATDREGATPAGRASPLPSALIRPALHVPPAMTSHTIYSAPY